MTAEHKSPAKSIEIGLVLQGGGALGAYEYGGITGLLDAIDAAERDGQNVTLKIVAGVSIGAINAACVVGARDRADARARLKALWDDLMIAALPFVPSAVTDNIPLWYVPHFYTFQPTLTSLYNTHPLLGTLSSHVDFKALNASSTIFVVTAADVESGELKRFANRDIGKTKGIAIEPHHVLASGSLPPQFPWTDIGAGTDVHHYWDGGVVDNTPLGDAIDASQRQRRREAAARHHEFVSAGGQAAGFIRGSKRSRQSAPLRQPSASGQEHRRPVQRLDRDDRGDLPARSRRTAGWPRGESEQVQTRRDCRNLVLERRRL